MCWPFPGLGMGLLSFSVFFFIFSGKKIILILTGFQQMCVIWSWPSLSPLGCGWWMLGCGWGCWELWSSMMWLWSSCGWPEVAGDVEYGLGIDFDCPSSGWGALMMCILNTEKILLHKARFKCFSRAPNLQCCSFLILQLSGQNQTETAEVQLCDVVKLRDSQTSVCSI